VWSQTGIYAALLVCDRRSSHRLANDVMCLPDGPSHKLLMTCEGGEGSDRGSTGALERFQGFLNVKLLAHVRREISERYSRHAGGPDST
jgi:hypothetical protein